MAQFRGTIEGQRVPELERQALGYRLERQALAAAELAKLVACYQSKMEE